MSCTETKDGIDLTKTEERPSLPSSHEAMMYSRAASVTGAGCLLRTFSGPQYETSAKYLPCFCKWRMCCSRFTHSAPVVTLDPKSVKPPSDSAPSEWLPRKNVVDAFQASEEGRQVGHGLRSAPGSEEKLMMKRKRPAIPL